MDTNDLRNGRLSRREVLAAAARMGIGAAAMAGLGGTALNLAGCGSSDNNGSPVTVNRTGRFVSADSFAAVRDLGVNIGHTFVVLENGVPLEVGWEMPENMLNGLPNSVFDSPDVYFLPLPPEADALPFKYMAFSDWANGHVPVGIGDAPHIHPLIAIGPPMAPTDDNHDEKVPVANPDEIPEGYILGNLIPGAGDTIASGIGEAYEYPEAPQLQPGWNTTAQNYFFYKGHLNAIGMGATYDFLSKRQTMELPVTQPKLYPRAGWYPTKNITTWDDGKKVHVFKLTNFVRATNFL